MIGADYELACDWARSITASAVAGANF